MGTAEKVNSWGRRARSESLKSRDPPLRRKRGRGQDYGLPSSVSRALIKSDTLIVSSLSIISAWLPDSLQGRLPIEEYRGRDPMESCPAVSCFSVFGQKGGSTMISDLQGSLALTPSQSLGL